MLLRCHIIDANPRSNISFTWYHNDSPVDVDEISTIMALDDHAAGSYECEPRNAAGVGQRCGITHSGRPVAEFVSETDYSYLIFGGIAVVVVFAAVLLAVLGCRKEFSLGKYYPNGNGSSGCNGMLEEKSPARSVYAGAATASVPPPNPFNGTLNKRNNNQFDNVNNNGTLPRNGALHSAAAAADAQLCQQRSQDSMGSSANSRNSGRRVTLNTHKTAFEFEEDEDDRFVDDSLRPGLEEEETELLEMTTRSVCGGRGYMQHHRPPPLPHHGPAGPPPPHQQLNHHPHQNVNNFPGMGRVLNVITRTCDQFAAAGNNVRSPRELWLV